MWYEAHDPHGGVAPGAVPGSPTVSSVVSHPDGGATIVSFEPPTDDGGHTVHTYTVRAYDGSSNQQTLDAQTEWTGALSPITVPGTVDGTAYFFAVTADNTLADVNTGEGAASASLSGTAFRQPDPPTGVYAISKDSKATVNWAAPTDTGGASIMHYVIYTTPAIDSTCGDAGDAATCGALGSEMVCNGVPQCAWDATDADGSFCSVRCSVVVASGTSGDVTVKTDRSRISEVFRLLIGHAIKVSHPGCEIAVRLALTSAGTARCAVLDCGPGLTPAEERRLFRRYARFAPNAGNSTLAGFELVAARERVAQLGGHLWFEPNHDNGTTYIFDLPCAPERGADINRTRNP